MAASEISIFHSPWNWARSAELAGPSPNPKIPGPLGCGTTLAERADTFELVVSFKDSSLEDLLNEPPSAPEFFCKLVAIGLQRVSPKAETKPRMSAIYFEELRIRE